MLAARAGFLRGARTGGPGRAAALALVAGALALRIVDPGLVTELRVRGFDSAERIWPRASSSARVAIVDIDEKSLAQYGQWQWPRHLVAELVRRIAQGHPLLSGLTPSSPNEIGFRRRRSRANCPACLQPWLMRWRSCRWATATLPKRWQRSQRCSRSPPPAKRMRDLPARFPLPRFARREVIRPRS